ncbi:hypothetical protein CBR_g1165 [Chara braunii]|uniref:Reverse transcriptase domain-containing protein n=1 Tax=Chara braunii TaxID=69332 RepID=A0A388KDB1_CHABU|nr:hypothetical protein CBR_g1165 [Chara braunii]|eukprot:GBG68044.1 hypothetical protein CBR_g1165 [Chara braunii]
MDDILVFSKTHEYHREHIEWVLHALKDAGFKVALEKREFFLSEISFLRYIVTVDGLKPDLRKVAAVQETPAPVTLTQVRVFLGLASYYRRFIKGFARVAKPLTNLLKKEEQLIWTPECEAAFQALKEALTSAPVLTRPDPTRPFALYTDWQPQAISAVLTQHGADGREHVIENVSKTLSHAQANYEACKGECLAVVWGIQHFRPYLYGQKFVLVTDHQPLLSLRNNTDDMGMLGRWAVRLQDYDFDICHRATRQHGNADGLTRLLPPNECPANERLIPWRPEAATTKPRYGELHEHELLEHFQPPISDALLRNRFNDDRQLRFDIQQVNVSAPSVADLAVYSLLAQLMTYAGVYVDISPVPGQESTRVFIEFRAIQVATNFVHSIATFTGDLTVLPGHDQEPTYRFLHDYALQVARSVARVQARGTHRFTTYEGLLRRTPEEALALVPQLPSLLPPAEPLNIQALPYPMRNFPEYLVELTDVEQLPPADEDAWELHRALYLSVVLGMFTFFVEHEVHNVGEFLYVYYIIAKPKPERKEGMVALYPFGRIRTNRPGLLQLIHIELLSIAQVIAAEEEDLQLRLRTASAPCRAYNAAVIPDYLAREGESVVDFGHEDKPLRPPSSYPKPAALKALKKRTVPKRRRSPSPEAQASRVGPVEEVVQPAPVGHQAEGGDWDEFHILHPDPPSLQDRSDFASPREIPRSLILAVPPSRTVHQTGVDHMVELATIRLEAIEGAPRPDPAWEAFLQPPFEGCIAARLAGTLIYETGGRPNIMYHILVFAVVKRERKPYTETHLVLTGPRNRPLRRRIIRAIVGLAPRVLSHVPGAFLYPSFVRYHFNEVELPANLAALAAFLPPLPPPLNPEIDYFL